MKILPDIIIKQIGTFMYFESDRAYKHNANPKYDLKSWYKYKGYFLTNHNSVDDSKYIYLDFDDELIPLVDYSALVGENLYHLMTFPPLHNSNVDVLRVVLTDVYIQLEEIRTLLNDRNY